MFTIASNPTPRIACSLVLNCTALLRGDRAIPGEPTQGWSNLPQGFQISRILIIVPPGLTELYVSRAGVYVFIKGYSSSRDARFVSVGTRRMVCVEVLYRQESLLQDEYGTWLLPASASAQGNERYNDLKESCHHVLLILRDTIFPIQVSRQRSEEWIRRMFKTFAIFTIVHKLSELLVRPRHVEHMASDSSFPSLYCTEAKQILGI